MILLILAFVLILAFDCFPSSFMMINQKGEKICIEIKEIEKGGFYYC
jgi:hypothetical protein